MTAERIVAAVVALASLITAVAQYQGKESETKRADEYSNSADVIAASCVPALIECMQKGTE